MYIQQEMKQVIAATTTFIVCLSQFVTKANYF
jgi:hypothetical protein